MSTTLSRQTRTLRVAIIDDHPIIRHGLRELLAKIKGFEVVGETGSAAEAVAMLREQQPDVAVLDLTLAEGSGLEVLKQVRSLELPTRFVVSSVHDEMLFAERVLQAGALGYVNKEEGLEELVEAIRHVAAGHLRLSRSLSQQLLHRKIRGQESEEPSLIHNLSDRELEVFALIGQGLTTRQIADQLHLSPKTVETHREHIRTKLNLPNNNQLLRKAVYWSLDES